MEISLRFNGLGINDKYQAEVFIYDNNELIYKGKTYNGSINIYLNNHHYYKIKAIACGEEMRSGIYINRSIYTFSLTTSTSTVEIQNPVGATITLTDTNYANLPIETGTLTFAN